MRWILERGHPPGDAPPSDDDRATPGGTSTSGLRVRIPEELGRLTVRELEVAALVAEGLSSQAIASKLPAGWSDSADASGSTVNVRLVHHGDMAIVIP